MFRRLFFDHWVSIFALVAFVTAASVYFSMVWRALRMRRGQADAMAALPFTAAEDPAAPVPADAAGAIATQPSPSFHS